MMLFPLALFVLLLSGFTRADDPPPEEPSSCRTASVAAFSAALYSALVCSNKPDIVFDLTLPSRNASALLHRVVLDELNRLQVCNAVIAAKTVAKGVAYLPVFTLNEYFRLKAFTVAAYFEQIGILNCDNAVEQAFIYYRLVQELLYGPKVTIKSYMRAITRGILTRGEQLQLNLAEASHELAGLFFLEFSSAYPRHPRIS